MPEHLMANKISTKSAKINVLYGLLNLHLKERVCVCVCVCVCACMCALKYN